MEQTVQFALSGSDAHDHVAAALRVGHRIDAAATKQQNQIYYDTFDWRLYRANLVLSADETPAGDRALTLVDTGGRVVAHAATTTEPGPADTLPPGALGKRVARLVGVRRLLPVVVLRVTSRTLNILNSADKTVARVVIDSGSLARSRKPLPTYVYVRALKGYETQAASIAQALRGIPGAAVTNRPRLVAALAQLGRAPADYTGKLDVRLDPSMRADQAMKQLLRHLRRQMEVNLAGTIGDTDPEFLHDFRVAVRRARSLLTRVRRVLPKHSRDKFCTELKWLGDVTSAPRDLDVYLIEFDGYRQELPEAMRGALDPLLHHLAEQRVAARATMNHALDSEHYAELIRGWTRFLTRPVSKRPRAKRATWPVTRVASAEIWRAYRKVRKQGAAITDASAAAELHELRKSAKQLRYLLEAFNSLYPPQVMEPAIANLKKLQNVLGTFQDLTVHGAALHSFASSLAARDSSAGPTLLAMGTLEQRLAARSDQVRHKFRGRFVQFDAPRHRRLMKEAFAP